jgi:3-hydroxyisobutyrate dehydrogenase-like beta-hydroxyacid dehydrogenase
MTIRSSRGRPPQPARRIGVLHPGRIGADLGTALRGRGYEVLWASDRRSEQTRARAEKAGLTDVRTCGALAARSDLIISVCPPHAALETARAIARLGFAGRYLDANAISPRTSRTMAECVGRAGARFINGDLIRWLDGNGDLSTRLYLSGKESDWAAGLFAGSPVTPVVLGDDLEAASAFKMCYAAYTKGRWALLLAIRALARHAGVEDALLREWSISQPGLEADSETAAGVARNAWRFPGELLEIAGTFEDAKLPGGFHRAAADLYRRLADLRDVARDPSLDEVLQRLLASRKDLF